MADRLNLAEDREEPSEHLLSMAAYIEAQAIVAVAVENHGPKDGINAVLSGIRRGVCKALARISLRQRRGVHHRKFSRLPRQFADRQSDISEAWYDAYIEGSKEGSE